MNPGIYLLLLLPLFIIYYQQRQQMKIHIKQHIALKHKNKEKSTMLELAKQFIDKKCIIYIFNDAITGTIKEISDNAILVDNSKTTEIINLDYIVRIRELPVKKK